MPQKNLQPEFFTSAERDADAGLRAGVAAGAVSAERDDRHELDVLCELERADRTQQQPRQRELAEATGISLGTTNLVLKRLAQRGLVKLRKINGRTIQYAVTPAGTREIARRSYRCMRDTIRTAARWKDGIDTAVIQAKQQGARRILLAGDSELGYMVEHSCSRHGLGFQAVADAPQKLPAGATLFMSEQTVPSIDSSPDICYLQKMLQPE